MNYDYHKIEKNGRIIGMRTKCAIPAKMDTKKLQKTK